MGSVKERSFKEKLEYYMSLPYTIEVIPDTEDGGYVAKVVELDGCITQADTWEELKDMIEDAKLCWIESALEDGIEIPLPKVMKEKVGV